MIRRLKLIALRILLALGLAPRVCACSVRNPERGVMCPRHDPRPRPPLRYFLRRPLRAISLTRQARAACDAMACALLLQKRIAEARRVSDEITSHNRKREIDREAARILNAARNR